MIFCTYISSVILRNIINVACNFWKHIILTTRKGSEPQVFYVTARQLEAEFFLWIGHR